MARSTKTQYRLRQWARIVLLAADGMATRAIGREVGCTTGTASKWRVRYAEKRLAGLDETGDRRGHNFTLNATFADIKLESYDALLIPGGRAPDYLRMNPMVIEAGQHFFRADKTVAAICHGAQILAAARVLEGRTCSAYPACRTEVELAHGKYAEIAIDGAVTDGKLVTAPA